MILNSEGVDEDFTNSFGVPMVLNRPSPRVGNPGLQLENTFGVREVRFCIVHVPVNSGPQKLSKKQEVPTLLHREHRDFIVFFSALSVHQVSVRWWILHVLTFSFDRLDVHIYQLSAVEAGQLKREISPD